MSQGGIEPPSTACRAVILTTILLRLPFGPSKTNMREIRFRERQERASISHPWQMKCSLQTWSWDRTDHGWTPDACWCSSWFITLEKSFCAWWLGTPHEHSSRKVENCRSFIHKVKEVNLACHMMISLVTDTACVNAFDVFNIAQTVFVRNSLSRPQTSGYCLYYPPSLITSPSAVFHH